MSWTKHVYSALGFTALVASMYLDRGTMVVGSVFAVYILVQGALDFWSNKKGMFDALDTRIKVNEANIKAASNVMNNLGQRIGRR